MGKSIIVIDSNSSATEQIVAASLDRSRIEKQFRVSKASCHVHVNPIFTGPTGKFAVTFSPGSTCSRRTSIV